MRSVRIWVRNGLLPKPKFRGYATTYDRATVLRALVVRKLRARGEGLELMVRTDGGALVERLAAEIVASYRAPSGG